MEVLDLSLEVERLVKFCILSILLALSISAASFQNLSIPRAFAVLQAQDADHPWPMYLHDLQHTGYTESPVPRIPVILWNYTMGGQSCGPVVAYGKVFLGSSDKKVYAFDQTTGEKIWEFVVGREVWAVPAVADGKVFIGSLDGKVYALDQADGRKLWEFDTSAPIGSSPIVDGNIVYIGSTNGKVYALDGSNGAKIWEFTTGGAIAYSSPAIAGDLLFIGSCDGYLYAMKKGNGDEVWKVKVSDGKWYVSSSPAVSSMRVFIGSSAFNKTYAFYHTGSPAWEYAMGGRILGSPSIAYNKVFISSLDGRVYALDQDNGTKIWEFSVGVTAPSLAVADEMVIVPSSDGRLYALDQSTGFKIWDIAVGGARAAGTCPAIADGKIYVVFGNTLYAITSRSVLTLSTSQTRVNVGSTVIVSGRLFPERLNVSIIIQWRDVSETVWRTLASVLTNATGHYTYSWVPDMAGSFELRATWKGDAYTLPSQSGIQTITVELSSSSLSISVSQTRIKVGSIVTIEGNLSPPRSSASIVIQWRSMGETTWRTLATATIDATGRYAYNWKPESEGSFELRAYWEGDALTLASQSDILAITIEPSPSLITMELLITVIAAVGIAVVLISYIKRRPK